MKLTLFFALLISGTALMRANDQKDRVRELLADANASFTAKDYRRAEAQLAEAAKLAPDSAAVTCNRGVNYHALGDDLKAIGSLHACVASLNKPEDKERYRQLITQLETKDQPVQVTPAQRQVLLAFNQELQENSQVLTNADESGVCKSLIENATTLPKTPSILFNLAKCSESAGKLEDAARYFDDYLKAAPDSAAEPEAKEAAAQLNSVLSFQGDKKDSVREHYRLATQYLAAGHYAAALKEYEAVRDTAPDFGFGRRQLGLFYEAMGRTDEAVRELTAYAAIESAPEEEKIWARQEIASIPAKRAQYDAALREGYAKLRPLLFTGSAAAEGEDQAQCDDVIAKLHTATEAFPLAPEANRLLGFLYVEADYPAGAKNAYDAAVANGANPFFFGWVSNGRKNSRFALIQVESEGLRVEPIYKEPKKHKKNEAASQDPESCNALMTDDGVLVSGKPCGELVTVGSIQHIESKFGGVEIKQGSETLRLRPVNLFTSDSSNEVASRKYNNRYARVIQRYMKNDVTKLGAEHMTGGQKFGIAMSFAAVAMGGAAGAMSAVGASQAALSASMSTLLAMQMLQSYHTETALIARAGSYKPIPVDPAPLAFRVD